MFLIQLFDYSKLHISPPRGCLFMSFWMLFIPYGAGCQGADALRRAERTPLHPGSDGIASRKKDISTHEGVIYGGWISKVNSGNTPNDIFSNFQTIKNTRYLKPCLISHVSHHPMTAGHATVKSLRNRADTHFTVSGCVGGVPHCEPHNKTDSLYGSLPVGTDIQLWAGA